MKNYKAILSLFLISLCYLVNASNYVHSNQFYVKIKPRENFRRADYVELAKDIAKEFPNIETYPEIEFGDDEDFLFQKMDHTFNTKQEDLIKKLNDHKHVHMADQARAYRREKRGYKIRDERDYFQEFVSPIEQKFYKSMIKEENMNKVDEIYKTLVESDPLFAKEWYIKNSGQADGIPGLDLNVIAAWADNITGRGVITAIMDDGIDYLHPDLSQNYASEASYDFSSNDPFPYPRYTDDWFNSHGTRCAGEVVAMAGNGICGVGVAPNSKIAGLRMLDQPYMTDMIEAAAMSHARDKIDIYSASWGPTDDGRIVDGPRNQTMKALVEGVNKGRKGKGALYVWASGDGGADDDCNCDGYAASMWTISINSATNDGQTASYDESCSSTLASTFSNGKAINSQDAGVGTVDIYGKCTLHHSGTSAAAPEAAGVYALALEANPNLTWRDVQYLTVLTSKRNHLYDHKKTHNWTVNGAGLEFNHLFGFGVLDAGDMVKMAKSWRTVPERFHCVAGSFKGKKIIKPGQPVTLTIDTNSCLGDKKQQINFIEHVQAFVTVKATRRGDLNLYLTSPMETTSMILGTRRKDDDSVKGFTKWPFMTTQTWGENPRGKWTLTVAMDPTKTRSKHNEGEAILKEWILMIHGTQESPYTQQIQELDDYFHKLETIKREHRSKTFIH